MNDASADRRNEPRDPRRSRAPFAICVVIDPEAMTLRRALIVVWCAVVVAPASARAQDPPARSSSSSESATFESRLQRYRGVAGGLRADDAARRAHAASIHAAELHEDLRTAAARLDQAIVAYFPRLSLSARYTHLSPIVPPPSGGGVAVDPALPTGPVPPGTQLFKVGGQPFPVYFNQFYLSANLTVPISDYFLLLIHQHAAAGRRRDAAQLLELAERRRAAVEARLAYYSWLRARAEVLLAQMSLEQAEAHAKHGQHLLDAGRLRSGEVMTLEAARDDASLVVERARSFEEVALARVKAAMNDTSEIRYEPGESLLDAVVPDPPAELATLQKEALRLRPELRAAALEIGASSREARAQQAELWPRLDATAGALAANPNPRYFPQQAEFRTTWDVGVALTWVPNETAAALPGRQVARANYRKAALHEQALRRAVEAEVLQAHHDYRNAKAASLVTQRTLATQEVVYHESSDRYAEGMLALIELNQAESNLFQARLHALDALSELRATRARLLHAIGR